VKTGKLIVLNEANEAIPALHKKRPTGKRIAGKLEKLAVARFEKMRTRKDIYFDETAVDIVTMIIQSFATPADIFRESNSIFLTGKPSQSRGFSVLSGKRQGFGLSVPPTSRLPKRTANLNSRRPLG
jgi:hypothetical protein